MKSFELGLWGWKDAGNWRRDNAYDYLSVVHSNIAVHEAGESHILVTMVAFDDIIDNEEMQSKEAVKGR